MNKDRKAALSDWGSKGMGARIRAAREALGWTQAVLAAKAGTSRHYLSSIENGKEASFGMYRRLAGALEVAPEDLYRDTSLGLMVGGSFAEHDPPEIGSLVGKAIQAKEVAFAISWLLFTRQDGTLDDGERAVLENTSAELIRQSNALENIFFADDPSEAERIARERIDSLIRSVEPTLIAARSGGSKDALPLHPNVWRYTSGHAYDTGVMSLDSAVIVHAQYSHGKPLRFGNPYAIRVPWFFRMSATVERHAIVIQATDSSLHEMGIEPGDIIVTYPEVPLNAGPRLGTVAWGEGPRKSTESAVVVEIVRPGLIYDPLPPTSQQGAGVALRPEGAAFIGRLTKDVDGEWAVSHGDGTHVSLRGQHFRIALRVIAVVSTLGGQATRTPSIEEVE